MQKAIGIIYDEHRSISAVLSALRALARMAGEGQLKPDFTVFRAMIYYIDAFPERMHHPKEDAYLFAHLERRDPDARALIAELKAEHVEGAKLVRDLEQTMLAYEQTWPKGAGRFNAAVEAYSQFHWNHMRREEHDVIPRAERALKAEDWADIEAAFAGNTDPIADLRSSDFNTLYQRILTLAPAPVGLGDSWKRA
ncbi:MAG TPA: hemerythrin domain-containing protein [Burkholderiales bacterium]